MELVHVSDTHLGYQAYGSLTRDGLNQREVDFQEAFRRVIDDVVERPPDLVVHSGDLFDVVRPSNRAIAFALEQVRRLSEAKIPFLVVSGNHEAPRLRETGSILRVFDGLPHVHSVYRGEYEAVKVETRAGPITVHAVPQTLAQADFAKELLRAQPQGNGPHLLTVHGTVAGVDGLFMHELNELVVPHNALRPDYDYIALGHFHNHRRIGENAAYSGSTERASFSEAAEEKVALRVTLGGARPRIEPWATGARPMRDAGALDASGWDSARIMDEARQRLAAITAPGAIVRLQIRGVEPHEVRLVDLEEVRRAAAEALHVDVRFDVQRDEHAVQDVPHLASIDDEFDAFLSTRPLPGLDRERIRQRAHAYLRGETTNAA